MKNNDIVKRIKVIPIYELDAIKEYLESMAKKGFFFIKHNGFVWQFKKGEPQSIRYYVDVFDKASDFDTRPEAETLEYLEYCKNCGWIHIFSEGKLQFFASYEANPIDIQTDSMQRIKLINKMSRTSFIFLPLIFIIISVPQIIDRMIITDFTKMSKSNFAAMFSCGLLVMSLLFTISLYLVFLFRNISKAKNNETLVFSSYKKLSVMYCTIYGLLFATLVISSCIVSFAFGISVFVSICLVVFLIFTMNSCGINRSRRQNKARYIITCIVTILISVALVSSIVFIVLFVNADKVIFN